MENIFQEFQKLPLIVKAKQWFQFGDHPDVIATMEPTRTDFPAIAKIDGQVVNPGDWIVHDGIGKTQVIPDDVFKATHNPVIESNAQSKILDLINIEKLMGVQSFVNGLNQNNGDANV